MITDKKTNICCITWSNLSPEENLPFTTYLYQVTCCLPKKVRTLVTSTSDNNQFLQRKKLNMYVMENSQGIECALWPHLYSKESCCDTIIKGNALRLSFMIAFYMKVLSGICDYAMDYELLQFHYEFCYGKKNALFTYKGPECKDIFSRLLENAA